MEEEKLTKEEYNRLVRIQQIKLRGVYGMIMAYPYKGIPRCEKNRLCEWLMKENGDI